MAASAATTDQQLTREFDYRSRRLAEKVETQRALRTHEDAQRRLNFLLCATKLLNLAGREDFCPPPGLSRWMHDSALHAEKRMCQAPAELVSVEPMIGHYEFPLDNHSLHRDKLGGGGATRSRMAVVHNHRSTRTSPAGATSRERLGHRRYALKMPGVGGRAPKPPRSGGVILVAAERSSGALGIPWTVHERHERHERKRGITQRRKDAKNPDRRSLDSLRLCVRLLRGVRFGCG